RALAAHRLGPETAADRALLAWAREQAAGRRPNWMEIEAWRGVVAAAAAWAPPPRPFDGADAQAFGFPPGPALGAALDAVEAWWIEGGAVADRDACLARLKAFAQSRS
ncbi:MAG: CCA tRNA nucleotidyltransferase, partial [Pseudomonadota bacterium]